MKEKIITHKGKKYKVVEVVEDYKTIKFKGKEFRIYKWENKPVGDFLKEMPKGFRLATHAEFIDLFDIKKINYPEKSWEVYFTEHFSKRKKEEGYLSRGYLNGDSFLDSGFSNLADSSDNGRVVVVK